MLMFECLIARNTEPRYVTFLAMRNGQKWRDREKISKVTNIETTANKDKERELEHTQGPLISEINGWKGRL